MDKITTTSDWIDKAILSWRKDSVKLNEGICASRIAEVGSLLGIEWEPDFIAFYQKVNGFESGDWNQYLFSVWSIERILEEYQESNDKNYIGFCDYLLYSHSIGFVKSPKGIFKSYDFDQPIANSFKEVIELINSNSDFAH